MKKSILIVTHSNDHEGVDKVIAHLEADGHNAIRLDTDLFPTKVSLSLFQDNNNLDYVLTTPTVRISGSQIDAVWYRRFAPGAGLVGAVDKAYLDAAMGESREVLLNFLANLTCFKVDDYWTVRRAGQKELQLAVARELGMTIPATLISNEPDQVKAFINKHKNVVAKMLHSFAVYQDNKEQVVFTSDIQAEHINDSLTLCPMVFQQKIAKQRELRITVVGEQCFCIGLQSQNYSGAEVDWRRQGLQLIDHWQIEALPAAVQAQCLALCRKLNLNYGAIDIIVDTDGRYVFLEVNPSGEFYWAEQFNDMAITRALAQLLSCQPVNPVAVQAA